MRSASELLVDASGLSRTYFSRHGQSTAISSASFAIGRGARIAVIGPSGSGKSTLLQIIAGLDEPSAGAIAWPLFGPRAKLRPANVAMMFQSPSLLPTLNVLENTMLPLALLDDVQKAAARANLALAAFGVEALSGKLPQELSGGQAQRVALARAIITDPQLLVADEPTGQLDRSTAALVMSELSEWAASAGSALIVATHDPEVAAGMTTAWHMDHGALDCGTSA